MSKRLIEFGVLLVGLALAAVPTFSIAQVEDVVSYEQLTANLSPEQKTTFGVQALGEMKDGVREVSKLLEIAEKDKDVVRMQCLSKKLTIMRALLEVCESSSLSMQEATLAGEDLKADHEYRKIYIALGKVRQFREEAQGCMGGSGQDSRTDTDGTTTDSEAMDTETDFSDFGGIIDDQAPVSGWQ